MVDVARFLQLMWQRWSFAQQITRDVLAGLLRFI